MRKTNIFPMWEVDWPSLAIHSLLDLQEETTLHYKYKKNVKTNLLSILALTQLNFTHT